MSAKAARRQVQGAMVEVADMRVQGRGLVLEEFNSRALLRHEIHELIVSTEPGIGKGSTVSDVAYVGFFEVLVGGMARIGDAFWVGDALDVRLGVLAGFDLTHFPNHYNIVVAAQREVTGAELGLSVGTPICLRQD